MLLNNKEGRILGTTEKGYIECFNADVIAKNRREIRAIEKQYRANLKVMSVNKARAIRTKALDECMTGLALKYPCPGNSEFEIVQILRDEEYQYGFEYNSEKIVMEWLYRKSLKTNRKVTIFERTMQKVNLGVSVRKECEAYKDQIPPETLLLSFFNKLKLKTDIFKTVYSGITDVLVFMSDDYEDTRFLDALLPKVIDGKKEKLLEFLTAIDIGIKDITYKEKETLFFTFHKGADGELYP